jgi:hypothetical protein
MLLFLNASCKFLSGPGLLSGIALGYGLNDRGVQVPAGAGNFYLHHRVQTGYGAQSASYPMGTRDSFPGVVKLTTHIHVMPKSKNAWSYASTPQYAFMAWCSVKKSARTTLLYFTLLYFTLRVNFC